MFSRRDTQSSKPTPEARQPEPTPPTFTPEPQAVAPAPTPEPVAAPAPVEPVAQNVSVIAAGDVFEGKLITTNGVRVQGTMRGTVESKSNINVEADAQVEADLTAENVTIAGTYKGKLDCNGRLEITASGRASGELETGRILLHEGGYFEGTLHMKQDQAQSSSQQGTTDSARRRYASGS
jgi:cytoskeletal protein CcmA (bactofilin family)